MDGKINPVTMMPDSKGACVNPKGWLTNNSTVWSGASSEAISERAVQYDDNCQKYTDNVKSGDTYKTLAIVGFAVGGAAAVGTIIYYIVDSKESGDAKAPSRERKVVFAPVYEPGFAGGIVSGRF
jgi:hypothetical protein